MISVFVDMECLTANISRAAVENQEQDWSMHHFAPAALSNPMIAQKRNTPLGVLLFWQNYHKLIQYTTL
jgi:hypothetical protein